MGSVFGGVGLVHGWVELVLSLVGCVFGFGFEFSRVEELRLTVL